MAILSQFLWVPWNFEIFQDKLFWPGLSDDYYRPNSLAISAVGLKFGGMMYNIMKHIAI